MRVYPNSTHSGAVTWPAPIEPVYQMLPAQGVQLAGYKRSDLSLADRLFISGGLGAASLGWQMFSIPVVQPCMRSGNGGAQECKRYP